MRLRPPGAVSTPTDLPRTFCNAGKANRPSESLRSGTETSSTPARRKAAAVALPSANQRCPGRTRKRRSPRAKRTAAGLVAITASAANACGKAWPASSPVNRSVETANTRARQRPAARRKLACWPTGRSEMTYHPANENAEGSFGMPKASHTPSDLTTLMNAQTQPALIWPAAPSLDALNASFMQMPPVAAMQIRAVACDGERLYLHAPLAANLNDKNCAFGGSLASVMTLSAWGLLTWRLGLEGCNAEVYVADSRLRYLAPLQEDLLGEAQFDDGEDWPGFLRCFRDRGRARIGLQAKVRDGNGRVVAEMTARFAALRVSP